MNPRAEIIQKNHNLKFTDYLNHLSDQKKLIYRGAHSFASGHEFLASNEFDWYKNAPTKSATDLSVGFGSNSLWDLAVFGNAKAIVFADASPWPLLTQAFIINPLICRASTVQELVFLINGLPAKRSGGLSLDEAFDAVKAFTLSPISQQAPVVGELLQELSLNENISDIELKFLTTFLRPRLGDNLNPINGYGPFYDIKNPNAANLAFYYQQRYSPALTGYAHSAFSSPKHFEYLKNLFVNQKIQYALTDVMDLEFYKAVQKQASFHQLKTLSLSLSNIFDCGYYNELTDESFKILVREIQPIFSGNEVQVHWTEGRSTDHRYHKADLQTLKSNH